MRSLDFVFSIRTLPPHRAIVLTAMATMLAAADWLPENRYVDPDFLEFAITLLLGASALAITVADRMTQEALATVRNRAILLTVTVALLGVAAEFSTRWLFRSVTTSADNGGFFSRRWARTGAVHLNAAGFRERAFTDMKPAGVYRIAVIGDSFTFGNGIPASARYSDLLQTQLPAHVEVLNFGQPGANTPEHLDAVRTLLPRVHPDFVLLQWYVNDVEGDDTTGRPSFRPLVPVRGIHDWLNSKSALYTVASMQWADWQVLAGLTSSYPDYLQKRLGDPGSRDSVLDRTLLSELIAVCERAGVPIGIVLFPDTSGPMDDRYQYGYLHARVLDVCAEHGLTCLDLRKEFSSEKDRRALWANQLDHHPGVRANEIAAEKILETWAKVWVASR